MIKQYLKNRRSHSGNVRFKKNRYKDIAKTVRVQLDDKDNDYIFKESGLNLNTLQYNTFRFCFFIVLLVVAMISYFRTNSDIFFHIIGIFILMLLSEPQISFLGKSTPFGFVMKHIKKEYTAKINNELYQTTTQLKNLALAQKDNPMGADFIIEQLMRFTRHTKPVFSQTLSIWRLGKEKEACDYFSKEIGTKLGQDFASVLLKLDQINPAELVEQIILFQTHIKEERITATLRKQEAISNIVFIPIIAAAFVIMLNFVAIVIWIDSMNTILNL